MTWEKIKEKLKRKRGKDILLLVQLSIAGLIFILFLGNVFWSISMVLPYLLVPLIVANFILKFVNHTKGLVVNLMMLLLIPGFYLIVMEFVVSLLGAGLGLYHLVRVGLKVRKELS